MALINIGMYLRGYVVFDDWRLDKKLGKALSTFIARNLFFILSSVAGLTYLILKKEINRRSRKYMLKEFE